MKGYIFLIDSSLTVTVESNTELDARKILKETCLREDYNILPLIKIAKTYKSTLPKDLK